jgi:hypothetical protein
MNIKTKVVRSLISFPGFKTNRKIVVIESDDWGSVRMPSREVYDYLLRHGYKIHNSAFNRYDSLASETDLSLLFDVLHSVKDKNNNPAIITANTIVANPDFLKIKASGYQHYYYEPFTETLKHYSSHHGSFELWQDGMTSKVFRPQFHGREHVNVSKWMKALQNDTGKARFACDLGMFHLSEDIKISVNTYLDTLNLENENELNFQKESLSDGLNLFENIFGYKSATFIAPCYIWDNGLEPVLANGGVRGIQGSWFQLQPTVGIDVKFKRKFHYLGQKNKNNQSYLVRNVHFEPSVNPQFDWVSDVLQRMKFAFLWHKPVIISSHRLNFIGFIDPKNRERNLELFGQLLKEIIRKWPDIEFMSSDQLLEIMNENEMKIEMLNEVHKSKNLP